MQNHVQSSCFANNAGPSNNVSQGFTVFKITAQLYTQSYNKMIRLEVPSGKLWMMPLFSMSIMTIKRLEMDVLPNW